jgi:hypothetical protein
MGKSAAMSLILLALSLGACTRGKSEIYAACYRDIAHYLEPRPQGSPPDSFLIKSISLCMMSYGFALDESVSADCGSPRTMTSACFRIGWPITRLLTLFK